MSDSISSALSAYYNPYNSYSSLFGSTSGSSSSSSVFDVSSTSALNKQQAAALVESYKNSQQSVKTLKASTAQYLDNYTLSMKTLDQSAEKLRLGNLDKLLYNSEGKITEDTIGKTVSAVEDLVKNYNSSLKLLNDNADRGAGTVKQLAKMAVDPMSTEGMAQLGITANDDGTLKLDSDALKKALSTTNEGSLKLTKDLLGGWNGLADSVHKDAVSGLNTSARELINSDLYEISSAQKENPFRELYANYKGSAYGMMNQAASGMLMNMLA